MNGRIQLKERPCCQPRLGDWAIGFRKAGHDYAETEHAYRKAGHARAAATASACPGSA
jgi:hypothetical protein